MVLSQQLSTKVSIWQEILE